ncbi:MAG: type IV secretion system protein [Pseudobutyrivibrio sp.]|nr:type IV secretion system protein [Pseudobutyrivibrio sp.]
MNFLRLIMWASPNGAAGVGGQYTDSMGRSWASQEKETVGTTILERMYQLAYKLFNHILNGLEFPHMTGASSGTSMPTQKVIETGLDEVASHNYSSLWGVAEGYFKTMLLVAVPIATVFFVIAIYTSVVNNPPEEHPKHFIFSILRYSVVLIVLTNLFNILTCVTEITEGATDTIIETGDPANSNSYDYKYDDSPIKAAIERRKGHPIDLKKFTRGDAVIFFDSIFEYITLFIGALFSMLVFGTSAFTIVMTAIQRIVKPLMLLPFSAIVLAISACSGEGERTLNQYIKTILSYCFAGVFMVMSLKLGSEIAKMNLIRVGYNFRSNSTIAALAGVINMNLPVILTTGLIKSSDAFMNKVFS